MKSQPAVLFPLKVLAEVDTIFPKNCSDFHTTRASVKKFTLAQFSGHRHFAEIGSIKSQLQSGLKDRASTAATQTRADSGHGSIIMRFTISRGLFLLPCIDNMKTKHLKILKTAVEKQNFPPNPKGEDSARQPQGQAWPTAAEGGCGVDAASSR